MIGIFTDPWMVDFYGKLVGKYTSPMGSYENYPFGIFTATWNGLNLLINPIRGYYITHFGGESNLMQHVMGHFEGFPLKIRAFFGLVSYNDPCLGAFRLVGVVF